MCKKIVKDTFILIITFVLLFSLSGCGSNNDNETKKDKIESQMAYLDTKLVAMLNEANGISIENYIVKAEKISESEESKKEKTTSQGASTSQGEESQSESGGSGETQGSSSGSSESSSSSNSEQPTQNDVQYKMVENEILLQDRTPDWESLKADIEKLYATWTTIQLDLYKIDVNSQDILNFNTDLDTAIQTIKKEDKIQSLNALAKLYSYIPKYTTSLNNGTKNSIYKTKSNLLNAYALVEQDDFTKVKQEITNAEQAFLPVINNMNTNTKIQFNINKAYILLKEIQKSIDMQDKDIFYIKYKNLIQELDTIK